MKPESPIPIHCTYSALVDPTDLKPFPGNPNTHPPEQLRLLTRAIMERGWRHPIIVSRLSGRIVAGHARQTVAIAMRLPVCPVDYQDFASESEEREFVLADNRLAELAEMDNALLKDLLQELDTGETDLELTGYAETAIAELMEQTHPDGEDDAEPQVDRAEELRKKWGVQTGDLWLIGGHRLLCGDSTSEADVGRLLAGAVPVLMVTDPPYGVNYDASWRKQHVDEGGRWNSSNTTIATGKVEADDRADWREAWALFPGDVAYVWHAPGPNQAVVLASLSAAGFEARNHIIWAKQSLVFGRGHYHHQHEPCWYAVRKNTTGHWAGDRKQTTLWEIRNNAAIGDVTQNEKATGHSTQKPSECMARPMRNHDAPEVYDPFLGSGTTMVAAQNLGRKCYGLEISPGYVGVILQRMADAFPGIEIRRAD